MKIESLPPRAERSSTTRATAERSRLRNEILITWGATLVTVVACTMVAMEQYDLYLQSVAAGAVVATVEQVVFLAIVSLLVYGNFVYQFTRIGQLRRRMDHRPASRAELEAVYAEQAPLLTVLVPSYKEEEAVVRRTLLSAALQDYPNRRVVLLIDNPPRPTSMADVGELRQARQLPRDLQALFDRSAEPFAEAQRDFLERTANGVIDRRSEAQRLSGLYRRAAQWFANHAPATPCSDHGEALLADAVFAQAADLHRRRADDLAGLYLTCGVSQERAAQEYARLAALFRVEITSFERKRYVNLSHEANKAMNLNSYIGLMGGHFRERAHADGKGVLLERCEPAQASLSVPDSEFVLTLDADSIITPDYALRLTHLMRARGGERIAVAQTPYSTIPNAPGVLERIAGATTDIQYLIHQGFTRHNATYWVGANALLRKSALEDIKAVEHERGYEISRYIQDRTVIEDTESSVDLVDRGWTLFNYPERLAYSATPPDFGSLLIQRRRWANGGLIILPKLVRYLLRRPWSGAKLVEGFFRLHYLISIAAVNLGLLIVLAYPFEEAISSFWLPFTALPYFFLYARDLAQIGYRQRDLVGVYALNLLLVPVNLGGVFKSIQQGITRRKIPFGRTPKVVGRTATPALYIVAEYALLTTWVAAIVVDLWFGHWAHAAFAAVNSALLGYAILRFIGARESWEDLRAGLPLPRKPLAAADATAITPAPGAAVCDHPCTPLQLARSGQEMPRSLDVCNDCFLRVAASTFRVSAPEPQPLRAASGG